MKNAIFLFALLISGSAFADSALTCNHQFGQDGKYPVFTAMVHGENELTNLVWYDVDDGTPSKPTDHLVGEVNPRSIKYKGWLYFGQGIILPADFASTESFYASVQETEDGNTLRLKCLNVRFAN